MQHEKMISQIKENRINSYQKEILEKIDNFSYRFKRYNQHFSLAIGFCDESIDMRNFGENKRQTDLFIILEKNLCCIVLDCAPSGCDIKAASNLLSQFQNSFFDKEIFTCVISSEEVQESSKMVSQLFDILIYSLERNMNNMIVDSQQMLRF